MTDQRRPGDEQSAMTCAEATELAGLFVLDALEPPDRQAVFDHLAGCDQAHAEFAELAGVVPALASLAEPLDAPAPLKARLMDAVRADAVRRGQPARPITEPTLLEPPRSAVRVMPPAPRAWRRPWLSWAAAAAAVLLIAVAGAWGYTAQSRADREAQRAAVLADAIAVMSAPGSSVAVLRGSGSAAAASGFAAFAADGAGYVVMTGLPSAPAGLTYQAWYLVDGQPSSAGLLTVDPDGYAVLPGAQQMPGADVVALTLEPAGGSVLPTSDPIVVGELRANA